MSRPSAAERGVVPDRSASIRAIRGEKPSSRTVNIPHDAP
ncbi:MAG: hypothetical protein AVDCRST_MAG40-1705 [uncultured Gemmatimonadaceae bacterium]|uniref:Uncharacterized protein n=1 Tax=uncultured Gemmatimonadaceae bacterium TaxID=246130 RepID=A0A6J4L9X5_9BACT|nr:MAG: hypothetical protein AVDCRST_MAG40-1705 [uncultured Gemmatimonadaceae bacterium]